ncbi:RNF19B family protein [Megaselia abdita]
MSTGSAASSSKNMDNYSIDMCPICYDFNSELFYKLFTCGHIICRICLVKYLKNEINESRTDIACPECSDAMHPSDIVVILKDSPDVINKYEDFMVRRFLLSDPDSRWCPAPDCCYAVIASGCASCPRIRCQRPGCGVNFCYHCKAEWHPDQTCDAARASRHSPTRAPSGSISMESQHRDDIKPCPRCQVLIVKMDDGSCNHMVCSVCGSEFCWLCMKEISDLHYLSPSGCTFWGKKPWSRKKKLLWQLGTLVGAPVGIALVAGIAVPAMIIAIPVWVGKKLHARYISATKNKRNLVVLGGVAASILVSPVLAGLAVAIGVPILLFYVYGVVPVSLCRSGCGVSTTRDGFKFDFDEDDGINNMRSNQSDGVSVDAVSRIGAASIGEVSLSVASGSHLGNDKSSNITSGGVTNLTSNKGESTTALAGSITGHRLEVQADVSTSETASAITCVSEKSANMANDNASTKALAGSILSYKQQNDSANASEDGTSERVRFDTTVSYVDGKKDQLYDQFLYFGPSAGGDHDSTADKASMGSCRSFRGSERSFGESVSNAPSGDQGSSITGKRLAFSSRHGKLNSSSHRTLSLDSNNGSNNIPEHVEEEEDVANANTSISINVPSNNNDSSSRRSPSSGSSTTSSPEKISSRTSILRNLFFSQPESLAVTTATPASVSADKAKDSEA